MHSVAREAAHGCPERRHDPVVSLRRRGATEAALRCSMKLPQPGSGYKRCFECIPARSVLRDEHCVPSALVDAREVRNLAACKTLGISSKSQAGAAEPALPALIACTAAQR